MPAQSCYANFPELKKHEVPDECKCGDVECSAYGEMLFLGYIAEGIVVLKKPLVENANDIKFEIEMYDYKLHEKKAKAKE